MRKSSLRKRKKSKKILLVLIIILLAVIAYFCRGFFKKLDTNNTNKKEVAENMITTKEITVYSLKDNDYINYGMIGKNVELSLEKVDDTYLKIKDFDNYYVKYDDIEGKEISSKTIYDDRYKEYILFNYNVVTTDKTSFYDEEDNMVYTFNEGYSLPLIVKDDDKYGVEFNSRLLYIKKEESKLEEHQNTEKKNASGVGVLNYHAFYDETNPNDVCQTEICHPRKQFITQLDFLKENNILTLKMKELEYYMDGKINLPKSVLITIDDGGRDSIAVDLLTEYKMHATIFLITSWFDAKAYYKTDYIELHSHTHDMHDTGVCPGGQGGAIKCLPKEKIQEDLKQTREALNNTTYIAYPFYEYNDYAIENLKEAGFTMAFIGESSKGDNLAHVGGNKFTIHRFVMVTYTTLGDLEKYFNQIK